MKNKKGLIAVVGILILVGIGVAVYFALKKADQKETSTTTSEKTGLGNLLSNYSGGKLFGLV